MTVYGECAFAEQDAGRSLEGTVLVRRRAGEHLARPESDKVNYGGRDKYNETKDLRFKDNPEGTNGVRKSERGYPQERFMRYQADYRARSMASPVDPSLMLALPVINSFS